jgi:hypothetical protein
MARWNEGLVTWTKGLPAQMGYVVAGMAVTAVITGGLVQAGVLETPKPTPPNMKVSLRVTGPAYLHRPKIPDLPSIYAKAGERVAFYVNVTNTGESPATDTVVFMRQVQSPDLVLEKVLCFYGRRKGKVIIKPCPKEVAHDLLGAGVTNEAFGPGTLQYVVIGRVAESSKPGTLLTAEVKVDSTNGSESSDTAWVTVEQPVE